MTVKSLGRRKEDVRIVSTLVQNNEQPGCGNSVRFWEGLQNATEFVCFEDLCVSKGIGERLPDEHAADDLRFEREVKYSYLQSMPFRQMT